MALPQFLGFCLAAPAKQTLKNWGNALGDGVAQFFYLLFGRSPKRIKKIGQRHTRKTKILEAAFAGDAVYAGGPAFQQRDIPNLKAARPVSMVHVLIINVLLWPN